MEHVLLVPLQDCMSDSPCRKRWARFTVAGLLCIVALIVALVAFVAVKLLGLVIHVAIVAAAIGLIVGFTIARLFRRD